jgi:hypothetical protein
MRSRFPMSLRQKLEARLAVAKLNGGAAAALPRGNGRFCVIGRVGNARYTGLAHSVDRFSCDCRHGQYAGTDASCYHAACVYLRLLADRSIGEVA